MNGNATQMLDQEAAVAIAMLMDETRGLAMAGESGISADNAQTLRDQLTRRLNVALQDRIAAQDQRITDQIDELATLARIAEEYRTRRYLMPTRFGILPRVAQLGYAVRTTRPQVRAWAVAHLPYPVLSALRLIRARIGRS